LRREKWNKENKWVRFTVTLVIAFIGAIVFRCIKTPIPWLLGPMFAVLIGARFRKIQLFWPTSIRDSGLMIIGYSIGLSFTITAVLQIIENLPSMLLMTVLLVAFCAGIAFIVSKLSGVDYPTVLTGSIPGGLTQMIIFAEELKGIDITTVTFLHVARLIMIIFFVPFFVFGSFFGGEQIDLAANIAHQSITTFDSLVPNIILFALVNIIGAFAGKKFKIPTPFLLGPIFGTAILNISGIHGPALPASVLDISQFMIGSYIGLLLRPEKLNQKAKIITLALIGGFVMIIGSLGLSLLLGKMYHISHTTSLLSLAPGGMDQMGILAHEVHADLSMVAGYQLFRLFFIYFAVPPVLRWTFNKAKSSNAK
jgi:uncharacterized protein